MKYKYAIKFKHIAIITAITVTWVLNTSLTDKFPEPIWYEIDFGDGVTHLWSREIYYDIEGVVQETSDIVSNKYNRYQDEDKNKNIDKDKTFIDYQASYNLMKEKKERTKEKMDSILNSIN